MREVLFRGESCYDHTLVYGSLTVNKNNSCAITHGASEYGYIAYGIQVFPETIGQFTGLTDKNGKRVFEGDIVRIEDFVNAVVKWREDVACWTLQGYIIGNTWGSSMLEVIGNIHDNPELLKEQK